MTCRAGGAGPAGGVGFCLRCYADGHVVLALDPVAGAVCAAHRAAPTVARLVDVEDAGQLALTSLATAGRTNLRPLIASQRRAAPMMTPASRETALTGTAGDVPLETTRTGQDRLALPGTPRQRHATGHQVECARCAERGIDRQGLPFRFPGDPTPLCMPCWRSEQHQRDRRARKQLVGELWEGIGEAEAAAVCPVCGPETAAGSPGEDQLAPEPLSRQRRRRERRKQRPAPVRTGCWLCGDNVWLTQLREQFERDQAAAAAEVEQEFARIVARSEAEDRVAALEAWIERLQTALSAYQDGGGRGRPVELLAELAARDASARATTRGRPSVLLYVGAVLAVDSDWRSGRRGMPGRARTAELVGCSEGAVSAAWGRLTTTLGWAQRTKIGGRLGLAERMATGRWNDRAEFDVVPAHQGDPAARAPHVPTALRVLGELLEHAQQLLGETQDDLDELRARTGTVTGWPEHVRRAQMRRAVARIREAITSDAAATKLALNICTPHMVFKGEYLSSCLSWGLSFSRRIMIHSEDCAGQPHSGRRKDCASRSSTVSGDGDLGTCAGRRCRSLRVERPRTVYAKSRRSHRERPAWSEWAGQLARALVKLWPWLDRPGVKRAQVVATLGARLGPDWTGPALVRFVTKRHGRPLLKEPDAPLAYLRYLLDEALTGPVEPPFRARRTLEHQRTVVAAVAADHRDSQTQQRAVLAERDLAAVRGSARSAREELAALRARLPQRLRRPDRVALLSPSPADEPDWPEVAQPGSGPLRRTAD